MDKPTPVSAGVFMRQTCPCVRITFLSSGMQDNQTEDHQQCRSK
jgi:hypothetical protein